jgi:hypothetical protein
LREQWFESESSKSNCEGQHCCLNQIYIGRIFSAEREDAGEKIIVKKAPRKMIVLLDGRHTQPVVKHAEGIHLVSQPVVSCGIDFIHVIDVRIGAITGEEKKHTEQNESRQIKTASSCQKLSKIGEFHFVINA